MFWLKNPQNMRMRWVRWFLILEKCSNVNGQKSRPLDTDYQTRGAQKIFCRIARCSTKSHRFTKSKRRRAAKKMPERPGKWWAKRQRKCLIGLENDEPAAGRQLRKFQCGEMDAPAIETFKIQKEKYFKVLSDLKFLHCRKLIKMQSMKRPEIFYFCT